MKAHNWSKKVISLVISSFGFWHVAIANANAQAGNVLVYIAGNNPVTLDLTRQVVTNPVISSVNGKTSIVAGAFDQNTADIVKQALRQRGVDAQQTYISQLPNTSPSTLPNYSPPNSLNNDNLAQYRYVTAVPMSAGGMSALAQVQQLIPNAFISKSPRGDYIYAGGYTNRDGAESLKYFLRSQGLDARVLYF